MQYVLPRKYFCVNMNEAQIHFTLYLYETQNDFTLCDNCVNNMGISYCVITV